LVDILDVGAEVAVADPTAVAKEHVDDNAESLMEARSLLNAWLKVDDEAAVGSYATAVP
jgi:hypothetical protein